MTSRLSGFRKSTTWSWIALLAAIVGVAAWLQTGTGRALMAHAGAQPTRQPFTALSFTNPTQLPDLVATSGQRSASTSRQRLSFSVDNQTGWTRDYRWRAALLAPRSSAAPLANGTVVVPAGSTVSVQRLLDVSCPGQRVRVEVSLRGTPDAIGYWTNCRDGATQ